MSTLIKHYPLEIAAAIIVLGALAMTVMVVVLALRQGGRISTARIDTLARKLRTDALLLIGLIAAGAAIYAIRGHWSPVIVHALWLSVGMVSGFALLISLAVWVARSRGR